MVLSFALENMAHKSWSFTFVVSVFFSFLRLQGKGASLVIIALFEHGEFVCMHPGRWLHVHVQ